MLTTSLPARTLKKKPEHDKAINKGNQKTILFFIIVPMTHRQDRQQKEEEKRKHIEKKKENTFVPKRQVNKTHGALGPLLLSKAQPCQQNVNSVHSELAWVHNPLLDGPLPHKRTEKQPCNEAESSDQCIPRYTVSIVLTHCQKRPHAMKWWLPRCMWKRCSSKHTGLLPKEMECFRFKSIRFETGNQTSHTKQTRALLRRATGALRTLYKHKDIHKGGLTNKKDALRMHRSHQNNFKVFCCREGNVAALIVRLSTLKRWNSAQTSSARNSKPWKITPK